MSNDGIYTVTGVDTAKNVLSFSSDPLGADVAEDSTAIIELIDDDA